MSKSKVVIASFPHTTHAHRAVRDLVGVGVHPDRISVLLNERAKADFARLDESNKASEGAAIGGAAGLSLGALVAGLASVAALAVPGVGILAAGPIVAAFAGAGAGGVAGGLLGGLVGLGVPEHEAKLHLSILEKEGVAVIVQSDDSSELSRATKVLKESSEDVESSTGQVALL